MRARLIIGLFLLQAFLAWSAAGQDKTNQAALTVSLALATNHSLYNEHGFAKRDGELDIDNETLHTIIQHVYPDSIPVIDDASLPDTKYDVKITGTNIDDEHCWKALEPVLRQQLLLTATKEKRPIDIYEIRVKTNPPPGLKLSLPTEEPARYTTNSGSFRLQYISHTMEDLESDLDQVMPLPVYNETGLTNEYDFALDGFALMDQSRAAKSVNELGLSLEKVNKEKEVLVIRKIHLDLLTIPKQ